MSATNRAVSTGTIDHLYDCAANIQGAAHAPFLVSREAAELSHRYPVLYHLPHAVPFHWATDSDHSRGPYDVQCHLV